MIKINKGFLISFIVLLLINYAIGNFISYSLILVLIVIFSVDMISLLVARIFLNIEMTLDEVAVVGEKISIGYMCNKLSIYLSSNIFVINEIIDDISGGEERKDKLNLERQYYTISAIKRGKYVINNLDIEMQSIFNLISINGKYKVNKSIKIYPKIYSLNYNYKFYNSSCGIKESFIRSNYRTDDINNIRQYEVGDNLQDIHWKITAKENKLYTKTYTNKHNEEKIVIVSYYLEKDNFNYFMEEDLTSFVISLCKDFINRNDHIKLLINNDEKYMSYISNNIDISNLLEYSLENQFSFSDKNSIYSFNDAIENNLDKKNVVLIISNIDDNIKNLIDRLSRKGFNITIYFNNCNKNYSFCNNIKLVNISDYIKGDKEYEKRNIS
ncbi:DUF58 domain-containing protein [Clostridium bornimense]|uniref:DUF58 domain-containing protein n=1 Tax=Clostridium bornimense TaxID=1216932 RepID=UPI001C116235|nr:DUF58 domain-containing protein [Clostridium bornimense]MBU5315983.1 DUF58 domain-containing protein [Clostridium bornimense]